MLTNSKVALRVSNAIRIYVFLLLEWLITTSGCNDKDAPAGVRGIYSNAARF
eukprot:SAG31_NODE_1092_length_9957_cov_10.569284_5_plen_52_part_00